MPDLLLYSSTVDPSLFLFFSPSCYKHLLKQYLRLWTRPYCDEGKHISLGIQFAHNRHMPASTILFFTWPFSPDLFHLCSNILPVASLKLHKKNFCYDLKTISPWVIKKPEKKETVPSVWCKRLIYFLDEDLEKLLCKWRQAKSLYTQFTKVVKTRCPPLKPGYSRRAMRKTKLKKDFKTIRVTNFSRTSDLYAAHTPLLPAPPPKHTHLKNKPH